MSRTFATPSAALSQRSAASRSRRRGPLGWCAIAGATVFAGFLAMFSLDMPVLSIDFVMQNIPSMVIFVGAALGWWRSWAGAAWLGLVAVVGLVFFHTWHHWTWPLVINAPPIALCALFAIDAARRK